MESKKIALELAEVDMNVIKLEEAKFLVHLLKMYYLQSDEDDEKYKILYGFHKTPDQFKHMDLIKQLDNDKLTVDQFKEMKIAQDTAKPTEPSNQDAQIDEKK